jgi:dihydroaeruginoic acid synthetase
MSPADLRAAVAEVLRTDLTAADDDSNLFELGLQSLDLMRLAGRFQVTFEQMASDPRLSRWAELVASAAPAPMSPTRAITTDQAFPLTPVQQAYLFGRSGDHALGGVGCHNYLEFDTAGIDPRRLERAVRALFARHPMLRARFDDDATQRVLPVSPWPGLTVRDLSDDEALALRDQLSHRILEVGRGEVFDVRLTRLPGGADRIHFNVDMLAVDLASFRVLLDELTVLYDDPGALGELGYTFGAYLTDQAAVRAAARERARPYWQERLATLPGGPRLPLAAEPEAVSVQRFVRRSFDLPAARWRALERRVAEAGLTPSAAMATAYATVLSRWSGDERFLLGMPLFDRDLDAHPEMSRLVGDFSGLVLLEVDLSGDSFAERARTVQRQLHRDIGQAAYTGVDVLRDFVRVDVDSPRTAPVVFSLDLSAPLIPEAFADRFGEPAWMISQTPQIWLDHQIYRTSDGTVRLVWDAVDALFPAGMLDEMMAAYRALIHDLLRDGPEIALPETARQTRTAVNSSTRPMTGNLLHTRFFARAAERAGQPALLGPETVTHDELADRALRIAGALTRRGVGRGSYVAVVVPKGASQIAAVLGVLAAGAAYVPIGVDQPAARRDRIVELSGARVILDAAAVDAAIDATEKGEPLRAPVPADPGDTAYVIFTSGSTGLPKGVEVTHRAAVNTVEDVDERFGIGPRDRVLAVSALDFDLSVWDVFGLLAEGGAAVLVPESGRRDAAEWLRLCREHGVTVWNTVPALLDMLLTAADGAPLPDTLRLALLSGDWIGLDLPGRLAAATGGRCRFIALGGATEAAIWSNAYEVGAVPAGWRSIPYGTPLRNQKFRVVDGRGRDCPDWVPGELWIGGAGVALGYRGDPELSAARFPIVDGERWYRTGDVGRYRPDGNLEFLGRIDTQVKINGFRVELGEIESCLRSAPAVAGAVAAVVAKEVVAAVVESPVADRPTARPGSGFLPFASGPLQLEHLLVERLLTEVLAANPVVRPELRPVVDIWREYLAGRGGRREAIQAENTPLAPVATALEWAAPLYTAILAGDADATALLDDPVLAPEALNDLMPATAESLARVTEHLRSPRTVAEWEPGRGQGAARLLAALPDDVEYTLLGASRPALAATEKRLADRGYEVRSALPGAERHVHAFDAVVANNALHRMPDPETAVATMALLLAPGGRLYILERAHPTPLALVTALLLEAHAGRLDELRATGWLHGAQRWARACSAAGLTGVDVLHTAPTGEILLVAERPVTATGVDVERVRRWATERLPEHMVPARIAVLPALPLSANGKVDRGRLQAILEQGADRPRDVGEAPRGAGETFVADRWRKLLGLDTVGRDENFFRLGGDSLLATRFVAEVRATWGVDLPMRDVMRTPTVAGLGALIGASLAAPDFEEGVI